MIVQAAMTMLVLLGLSVFVVDYGVLWVGRAQAQNAADASAVAGAIARAYDDSDEFPSLSSGVVAESVAQVVTKNQVWFEPPSFIVSYPVCPPGVGYHCVRVDVHRDVESGNALPTFFGPVLGITSQGVRATATAQVAVGNGTTCLKPWAIPDKWIEHRPVDSSWTSDDVFEKYAENGPGAGTPLVPGDDYVPPQTDPSMGMMFASDLGLEITLSFANPNPAPGVHPPISPGFLLPLVLAGANTYEENIAGCNGRLAGFGEDFLLGTSEMGATTTAGVNDLIALDPGASWDAGTNNVQGSCAPGCAPISPRLVALALFDVDRYQLMRATDDWTGCPDNTPCVRVTNILGFFLDQVNGGGGVDGYIARYPGLLSLDNPTLSATSSFLPAISLVR